MSHNQTPSINQAKDINGILLFDRIPNSEFQISKFNIPSISLGSIPIRTPRGTYKKPDTELIFSAFTISMFIDEEWKSFYEIQDWMRSISLHQSEKYRNEMLRCEGNETSNAVITLTDNQLYPFSAIYFEGLFPTNLGEPTLVSNGTVEVLQVDVAFDYNFYFLERKNVLQYDS